MGSSSGGGKGGGKGGGSDWSLSPNMGGGDKKGYNPRTALGGSQSSNEGPTPEAYRGPPVTSPQPSLPPMPLIQSTGTIDTGPTLRERNVLAVTDEEVAGSDYGRGLSNKYGGSTSGSLLDSSYDEWF